MRCSISTPSSDASLNIEVNSMSQRMMATGAIGEGCHSREQGFLWRLEGCKSRPQPRLQQGALKSRGAGEIWSHGAGGIVWAHD